MSEAIRDTLIIPKKPPVDLEHRLIFDSLQQRLPAVYEQLSLPKEKSEELKREFFASDRATNPNLTATHLDQLTLSSDEQEWLEFKDRLLASEPNKSIQESYRWAINEAVAGTRLAMASASGDTRRYQAYNEFTYGRPNPEIFAGTADWFRGRALQLTAHESPQVAEAAYAVLVAIPDLGGDKANLAPSEETFQAIKEQHFRKGGYYALALEGVNLPEGVKVPNETGDPAILRVLKNIGSDYKIEDAEGTVWSASRYHGAMLRPAVYNMIYNRFIGLAIGHEARHILETGNGFRQSLGLFGFGLDRYEKGNEGRAIMPEQIVYESFEKFAGLLRWQDIMRRHFAISLAQGLSGETMSFSQDFAVMNKIDRLWERSKKPDDIASADAKADKRTWDLMIRVMRGTDGQGGAYLKDITYLEGNIACWQVAAENPELIQAGDNGKFDITNARHIAKAVEFGVIEPVSKDKRW